MFCESNLMFKNWSQMIDCPQITSWLTGEYICFILGEQYIVWFLTSRKPDLLFRNTLIRKKKKKQGIKKYFFFRTFPHRLSRLLLIFKRTRQYELQQGGKNSPHLFTDPLNTHKHKKILVRYENHESIRIKKTPMQTDCTVFLFFLFL